MGTARRKLRRAVRAVVVVALAAGLTAASGVAPAPAGGTPGNAAARGAPGAAATTTQPDPGRHTYTGTIGGAEYRVETPEDWNGTLVMYSHGYYPPEFPVQGVALSNATETEEWLLDHGYALAASNYRGVYGFQVAQAQHDQIALLDWFEANVGRPARTISTGQSMGGVIAVLLAERHPDRFDGVMAICAAYDAQATWNAGLDITYAVRTLLTDPEQEIDLVRARDPQASTQALVAAVDEAAATPQGRARLALVASLSNVTGWWSALAPPPATDEERIANQANWIRGAYIGGFGGPAARVDLEAKVGGNPSSNVGVDYRRQFHRSSQTELVVDAYRDAGLDPAHLAADLDRLNAAPRVAADPAAVELMHRTSISSGRTPVPVVTLHSTGDGGAVPDQGRWYAEQVRRHGDPRQLRQLYVERGQHCSTSAADEVVALQALLDKVETGRWPNTSPRRLNAAVGQFDPHFQQVLDFGNYPDKAVMPPAFTEFTPPRLLRPSR